MGRVGTHPFKLRTGHVSMGHCVVRFKTNNLSNPVVIEDSAGILAPTDPVVRAGQSQFRLNLRDRWVKVYAQAQLHEEQPAVAHVYDVTQAINNAATIYVRVLDRDLALYADTTGWEISIMVDLTNQLGRGET